MPRWGGRRGASGWDVFVLLKRKMCAERPELLQPAVALGEAACCQPDGIGVVWDDETLGCAPRSRLHWGERQQAAAVQGLRREL